MSQYVALLRGINVGGNNLIKMSDLKASFEKQAFRDVTTYIQSGNVVFKSPESSSAKLTREIEEMIVASFNCRASVVLRSSKQWRDIVARAPQGFGAHPALYRYDVIFLKDPLRASTAMKNMVSKDGVDQVHAGVGVLYFSRLISKASESQLRKLVTLPVYKSMTIRNWNTTTKLLRLTEG